MRPTIGITFSKNAKISPNNNYIKTIKEFDGKPMILAPGQSQSKIDGLMLTGGGDIHPKFYNDTWHPTLKNVDEDRDVFEIFICQTAISAKTPILGICRGIQIMAVTTGGTLYQDITSDYPTMVSPQSRVNGVDAEHRISINKGSLLNEILGRRVTQVNSAHHQAIKEIGNIFKATAHTKEKVIEAIEHTDSQFALGVQYHPERMTQFPVHRRKLFEAFIQAASEK